MRVEGACLLERILKGEDSDLNALSLGALAEMIYSCMTEAGERSKLHEETLIRKKVRPKNQHNY
jgi:hypothetical protein